MRCEDEGGEVRGEASGVRELRKHQARGELEAGSSDAL